MKAMVEPSFFFFHSLNQHVRPQGLFESRNSSRLSSYFEEELINTEIDRGKFFRIKKEDEGDSKIKNTVFS